VSDMTSDSPAGGDRPGVRLWVDHTEHVFHADDTAHAQDPDTSGRSAETNVGGVSPARHLYEIDLLRLITFAEVIAVHTIAFTVPHRYLAAYGLLMLLHCTREVFFALTAFVLVHGALRRTGPARPGAARRRFVLVGVPYLAWSAVYVATSALTTHQSLPALLVAYAEDVVMGTAEYHLYFLLVTMQVYLVMPLLVRLLRERRTHLPLLAGSLVVQLGITGVMEYLPGPIAWMHGAPQQLFPAYLFCIDGGGVAAARGDAFLAWVRKRRGTIALLVVAAGSLAVGVYAVQIGAGWGVTRASDAMQPALVLWSAAAAVGVLSIGAAWADRRREGRATSRAVAWASDRSFGIFLSHPLVLWALLLGGGFAAAVPVPWRTVVAYTVVAGGAVAITETLRRTPLSQALTGRPRLPRAVQTGGEPIRLTTPTPDHNGDLCAPSTHTPPPRRRNPSSPSPSNAVTSVRRTS
jgi:surface polysaccharide O-acyltransferase-like enzyme